ncbi:MAG: hypothetical protein WC365_01525 [Candidatus Babeliales bacterium]|jgi:hypothetical protein
MPETIEVGDLAKPIAVSALTKDEFIAMTEADKIKVLVAEKEEVLAKQDEQKMKSAFYIARDVELKAFDEQAKIRLGDFQTQLSNERTIIEKKWMDAEALGTFVIPQ